MKVLIVDDEAPARERLGELVGELEGHALAGAAADGRAALELCARLSPDVVLMDIRMPGMDGIEAARHLARLEAPPAVIFTTAYDEYALAAFEASAVGYLVKPVRRGRLADALQRAARLTRAQLAALGRGRTERRRNLCVRVGGRLKLIPVEDIRYFQAEDKYVTVRHPGGRDLLDEPLKDLEREFAPDFARIHRNALVAMRYVTALEKDSRGRLRLRLRGCEEPLAVSRRLAAEIRSRLTST